MSSAVPKKIGSGMDKIIAIPAESNEGLSASRSGHFGSAAYIAVIRLDTDGEPTWLDALEVNATSGGRHGIPAALKRLGVTDVVTLGVGQGMVSRLQGEGIQIWIERSAETVAEGAAAFISGDATPLEQEDINCASEGSGSCH